MSRSLKKDIGSLTREDSMNARPIRNPAIREEPREDGSLMLFVPVDPARWGKWFAKLMRLRPMDRRITLDEIGAHVWRLCDGGLSVRELAARFAERYKLGRKEAEVSMVHYLRTLAKKGLIGIMVPEKALKKTARP